jgi:hypothetical protein
MCGIIDLGSCIWWVFGFWHKNRAWHTPTSGLWGLIVQFSRSSSTITFLPFAVSAWSLHTRIFFSSSSTMPTGNGSMSSFILPPSPSVNRPSFIAYCTCHQKQLHSLVVWVQESCHLQYAFFASISVLGITYPSVSRITPPQSSVFHLIPPPFVRLQERAWYGLISGFLNQLGCTNLVALLILDLIVYVVHLVTYPCLHCPGIG